MIESGYLYLKAFSDSDFASLMTFPGDPRTMSFWSAPFAPKQVWQWIERNRQSYELPGFCRWLVIKKDSELVLGTW